MEVVRALAMAFFVVGSVIPVALLFILMQPAESHEGSPNHQQLLKSMVYTIGICAFAAGIAITEWSSMTGIVVSLAAVMSTGLFWRVKRHDTRSGGIIISLLLITHVVGVLSIVRLLP